MLLYSLISSNNAPNAIFLYFLEKFFDLSTYIMS